MRIAFLLHWNDGPESGVFKKVTRQASQWKDGGHEVRLFLCGRDRTVLDTHEDATPGMAVTLRRYRSIRGRLLACQSCPD